MDEQTVDRWNESLAEVMTRFRAFFTQHMSQDHVPLRHRDDFVAPLVTVLGYTFGVRLITGAGSGKRPTRSAVEVSVNVYDDEFDLERFKVKMKEAHSPATVRRTVENFFSPEDEDYIRSEGAVLFPSLFRCDPERDLELLQKEKNVPSTVTGRLVDTVLTLKYWIEPTDIKRLSRDLQLFKSGVYLYCLRTFTLAYHGSVKSS